MKVKVHGKEIEIGPKTDLPTGPRPGVTYQEHGKYTIVSFWHSTRGEPQGKRGLYLGREYIGPIDEE